MSGDGSELVMDLDDLEAKARAATPGPYRECTCGKCGLIWSIPADAVVAIAQAEMEDMPGFSAEQRSRNAAYAAAMSPDVALALIAEVRAARERDATEPLITIASGNVETNAELLKRLTDAVRVE